MREEWHTTTVQKTETNQETEVSFFREFSKEEQALLTRNLWELLKTEATRFGGSDSTSLRVERVESLLESMVYTLSVVREAKGLTCEQVLQSDLGQLLAQGQTILYQRRKLFHERWNQICAEAPPIPNVYYVSTLKSIGQFFSCYNPQYEAHEIPCSIDYPLSNPVPESLKGISFIGAYLAHMQQENQFLNHMGLNIVQNLLENGVGDYKEHYYNFSEVVLTNALGKLLASKEQALVGPAESGKTILLTEEEITRLEAIFMGKDAVGILELLKKTGRVLFETIGLNPSQLSYYDKLLHGLAMRIEIAAESGNLKNIFLREKKAF